MRYAHPPLRHGMTAIAAVLAFSSTALFAQSADPAPDSAAAPVLVTPPPVVSAPAPTIAAPTPLAQSMQTVQTLPPAPAVDTSTADESATKPVAHTRTATKSTNVKSTVTNTPVPAPVPVAKAPAAPVVAPTPVAVPESPVAAKAAPAPATDVKQQKTTQTTQATDETLPIAAGAGILVLALAGGAFALGRRKREDEEVEVVTEPVVLADTMASSPDPVLVDRPEILHAEPAVAHAGPTEEIVREPMMASERLDGPVTKLPVGFDLSRYGPHVQAAYRGPTADNPSLSLRRRLARARFYDQRERRGDMPAALVETREVRTPQPAPAAARTTDHITTRVRQPRQTFRPVFNS